MQFSELVENIVGKEQITCYEQFLRFPQCIQKLFVVDALKCVSMEYKGFNSLPSNKTLE